MVDWNERHEAETMTAHATTETLNMTKPSQPPEQPAPNSVESKAEHEVARLQDLLARARTEVARAKNFADQFEQRPDAEKPAVEKKVSDKKQ